MTAIRDVFDIRQPRLKSILDQIHRGEIALPNFAREWCWSNDHVLSLLESIAEGHPVGIPTLVDPVGRDYRPFSGVPACDTAPIRPQKLVLDGQQRLTAAYQACYADSPVAVVKGKSLEYRSYFFVMEKAASTAYRMKEVIFSVKLTAQGEKAIAAGLNCKDASVQYEHGIVPANMLLDFGAYESAYSEFWDEPSRRFKRREAMMLLRDFRSAVVDAFEFCVLPIQTSNRPLSVKSMCRLYETLNMHAVAA